MDAMQLIVFLKEMKMNEFMQKRRGLLEEISESLNIPLIEKLPTDLSDDLSSQIKEFILNHKSYKHPENLDIMLEIVFENMTNIADGFPALGRLANADVNINPEFYNKLNEIFVDFDSLKPDAEDFGTETEDQLCQYTLANYITIIIYDSVDDYAALFDDIDEAHFPLMYNGNSKQFIFEEIIKYYSEIYSSTFVENNLNLIKVHAYCKIIIPNFNNVIMAKCKLENNPPFINQSILNNSYDVIIDELSKLIEDKAEFKKILSALKEEKQMNGSLFTDPKRFAHLKSGNHYMSFLYKCKVGANTIGPKNVRLILTEFAESLIQGYLQAYEYSRLSESAKKIKIKDLGIELQTLTKYNSKGENNESIKSIEETISFLSQKKTSSRILPYKALSEKITIDNKQLSSYIKNTISINKSNLSDKIDKTVIQTSIKNINTTLNFIK